MDFKEEQQRATEGWNTMIHDFDVGYIIARQTKRTDDTVSPKSLIKISTVLELTDRYGGILPAKGKQF